MFKGFSSVSFTTTKPKQEVFKVIEDELQMVGSTDISDRGTLKISASKMTGFAHDASIEGSIREKEGKYNIDIEFQAKPNVICWVIVVCLFPLGLAALILPSNAKGDMQRSVDRALENIRREYK
jgi:hypothetical protein